ncbi:MAG: hypothetical protein H0T94_06260 [Acidimicrobiia bacterium]|nr:hypothetical protein [Acidimicrobiia bacterium]
MPPQPDVDNRRDRPAERGRVCVFWHGSVGWGTTRRTFSPDGNVMVRCLNADVSFSSDTSTTPNRERPAVLLLR